MQFNGSKAFILKEISFSFEEHTFESTAGIELEYTLLVKYSNEDFYYTLGSHNHILKEYEDIIHKN